MDHCRRGGGRRTEQKRMTDVPRLKADPPQIFVSTTPALLVQTDGAATFAPVKGKSGLSFVVSTNWDLFRIDEGGLLFLRDDTHWLAAEAVDGPWTPATTLPPLLKELPKDGNWDDALAAFPPSHMRRRLRRRSSPPINFPS
jgi:hypothetical protein